MDEISVCYFEPENMKSLEKVVPMVFMNKKGPCLHMLSVPVKSSISSINPKYNGDNNNDATLVWDNPPTVRRQMMVLFSTNILTAVSLPKLMAM